jgi:hypothetical protein
MYLKLVEVLEFYETTKDNPGQEITIELNLFSQLLQGVRIRKPGLAVKADNSQARGRGVKPWRHTLYGM